jgi:hypothetical protein
LQGLMSRPLKRQFTEKEVGDGTPPTKYVYNDLLSMSPPANLGEEDDAIEASGGMRGGEVLSSDVLRTNTPTGNGENQVASHPADLINALSPLTAALPVAYVPPRRFGSANGSRHRRVPVDVQEVMCRETVRYEQSHEFVQLRKAFLHGYFVITDNDERLAESEARQAATLHEARVAAASVHLAVGTEDLERMMSTFLGDGHLSVAAVHKFSGDSSRNTPLDLKNARSEGGHGTPSRWSAASPFFQPPTDEIGTSSPLPPSRDHYHVAEHEEDVQSAANGIFSTIPPEFAMEFLSSVPAVSIHDLERRRRGDPFPLTADGAAVTPRRLSRRESAANLVNALVDADAEIDEVVFVRGGKKNQKKLHRRVKQGSNHNVRETKDQSTSPGKGLEVSPLLLVQPMVEESVNSPLRHTMNSSSVSNADTHLVSRSDHHLDDVEVSPTSIASNEKILRPAGRDLAYHLHPSKPPLASKGHQIDRSSAAFLATLRTTESLSDGESLAQQEAMLMYRLEELQLSEAKRLSEIRQKSLTADILRSVPFQRPNSGESRKDVHDKVLRCLIAFEQLERRNLSQLQEQAFEVITHRYGIEHRAPSVTAPAAREPERTLRHSYALPPQRTELQAARIVISPSKELFPSATSVDDPSEALQRQLSPEDPHTDALLKALQEILTLGKEEETQRSLLVMREEIVFHRSLKEPMDVLRSRHAATVRDARLAAASEKLSRYMPVDAHRTSALQDTYVAASRELQWTRSQNELIMLEAEGRSILLETELLDAQRLESNHWAGHNLRGEYDWGRGVFRSSRPRWAASLRSSEESATRRPPSSTSARPSSSGMRYFGALAPPSRLLLTPAHHQQERGAASVLQGAIPSESATLEPLLLRPETPSNAFLLPHSMRRHVPGMKSPQPPPAAPSHIGGASPFQRNGFPAGAVPSALLHAARGAHSSEAILRIVRLEIHCREELVQQYYRQIPLGALNPRHDGNLVAPSPRGRQQHVSSAYVLSPKTNPTLCSPLDAKHSRRAGEFGQMSLLAQTAALYFPMSSTSTAQRIVTPVFGGRLTSTGGFQLESPSMR